MKVISTLRALTILIGMKFPVMGKGYVILKDGTRVEFEEE